MTTTAEKMRATENDEPPEERLAPLPAGDSQLENAIESGTTPENGHEFRKVSENNQSA